jgi:hypothetical protein
MSASSVHEFKATASAYEKFDTPLPKPIIAAAEVLRAATAALGDVVCEAEPVIDVSSVKAVRTSIDGIATFRATAGHRVEAARAVERAADAALLASWIDHAHEIHETMRGWFNATAKTFVDTLGRLDGCTDIEENVSRGRGDVHAHAVELAANLTVIRTARAMLQGRLSPDFQPFWRWSQVVLPIDKSTTLFLDSAVRQHRAGKAEVLDGSLEFYSRLVSHPGVAALEYHDIAEQHALFDALPHTVDPDVIARAALPDTD